MDKFEKKASEIAEQLTVEELLGLTSTHQNEIKRFGLDEFYIGTEVARGYVGREPDKISTVFPQPIGLAGTFDTELMEDLGKVAGTEARAYFNRDGKGGIILWGPTVDMERDPRWGRTEEAYGEDPYLTGKMAAAYTRGMADPDGNGYYLTIPTLKHFCANNNENDRVNCDAFLPPRLKHEYYYAPFIYAIMFGKAKSIMTAYNSVNGVPAIMNPDIGEVLKKKYGLWFAVSDGGDFTQNVTAHRYSPSMSKAYAESLKAGCNIMTDSETAVKTAAKRALSRGLITEDELRQSAAEVIAARLRLGVGMKNCYYNHTSAAAINCEEANEWCLRAALEQVVLLKNDGILPIKNAPKKIAVVGPLADCNLRDWYTGYFTGAVSVYEGVKREFPDSKVSCDRLWDTVIIKAPNDKYLSVHKDGCAYADAQPDGAARFELRVWHGTNGEKLFNLFSVKHRKFLRMTDGGLKLHKDVIYDWFTGETFLAKPDRGGDIIEDYRLGMRMTVDEDGRITFVKQHAVTPELLFTAEVQSSGAERAQKLAKSADLIVWCVGNDPMQVARECYDRTTLALPPFTSPAVEGAESKTVMVLISSYPYSIVNENDTLPAILYTTHAGAHLGTAVARTISGKNNPSGHLAMTWYASDNDLPDIHDYDIEKTGMTYMYFKGTPLYPFGHGLSYSEFVITDMKPGSVYYRGKDTHELLFMTVKVRNVSDTAGTAVVQVYFRAYDSTYSRPDKKLCGFERIFLPAGAEEEVKISISDLPFMVYDTVLGRCVMEECAYELLAGFSSADTPRSAVIKVHGHHPSVRRGTIPAISFDDYGNVRICKDYVYTYGGWGSVTYRNADLSGARKLILKASAVIGFDELTVKINDKEYKAKVPLRENYDHFRSIHIPLSETPDFNSEITVILADGMGLKEITIE